MEDTNTTPQPSIDSLDDGAEEAYPWLPSRLERARSGAIRALLDELGCQTAEDLRQALAERTALADRARELEDSTQALQLELAFREACSGYTFYDVAEVRALADFSAIERTPDGTISGVREAIQTLVTARPHLVKRPPAPTLDVGDVSMAGEGGLTAPEVAQVKKRFRL